MDDLDRVDYADLWEMVTTAAHPSASRILALAQEIRAWAVQAPALGEAERASLLAHVTELELMAGRLTTLTASQVPPDDIENPDG